MIRKDPRRARLEQRSIAITTIMIFVLIVLLIQIWLVTIALEEYLAAGSRLSLPTFAASAACFVLNLWLLKYVYDIDRNREKD